MRESNGLLLVTLPLLLVGTAACSGKLERAERLLHESEMSEARLQGKLQGAEKTIAALKREMVGQQETIADLRARPNCDCKGVDVSALDARLDQCLEDSNKLLDRCRVQREELLQSVSSCANKLTECEAR